MFHFKQGHSIQATGSTRLQGQTNPPCTCLAAPMAATLPMALHFQHPPAPTCHLISLPFHHPASPVQHGPRPSLPRATGLAPTCTPWPLLPAPKQPASPHHTPCNASSPPKSGGGATSERVGLDWGGHVNRHLIRVIMVAPPYAMPHASHMPASC